MSLNERIDNDFKYHMLGNKITRVHMDSVRSRMKDAADYVLAVCPPGREQALALTKLEEAMFWANAGIARNQDDKS